MNPYYPCDNEKREHLSCYRCGDAHYATECPPVRKTCSHYKKLGHLARMCQSRDAGRNRRTSMHELKKKNANKKVPVHAVDDPHHNVTQSVQRSSHSSSDEETVYNMWKLDPRSSASAPKPLTAQLEVQGCLFRMELDAGASVSIIGKATWRRQFPSLPREQCNVQLRSYCGDVKPMTSKVTVSAKYNDHIQVFPFLIAEVDKYPIPKAEELWAELSGGVKFTKLHLKDAY
ncbi:hypothetical protein MTO96_036997 [Rhipicephalus appendiculatus]